MTQKKKYYAVRQGREIGIYETWEECKKQVGGYSGAEYKSFSTYQEASDFIKNQDLQAIDTEACAIAYVDGSYLPSEKKFSFGAVLFYKDEEKRFKAAFSDFALASMRNVAGEIKGSEFIMKYCIENNIPAVKIYYDYEGIEKWCTGAWKTNKEGTKAYRDAYLKYAEKISISFCKVKGHSGNKYNDLADSLAKSALGIER